MARRCLLLATVLVAGLSFAAAAADVPSQPKSGEASVGVLLDAIRANRRALIAVNLNLSEQESAQFWPIYDRYQGEMNPLTDRLAALVQDYIASYQNLTNEKALQLNTDDLSDEGDQIKLRQKYLPEFQKAVPGRTVARFYQIENKMNAVIRYELAATIPVVEEGNPASTAK